MHLSPNISVVIPAYNYGQYIGEAIESVLSQSFTDFELIVLNNASEDNTDAVVREYVSDPRVVYIVNETNIGPNNNFCKGIDVANGQYLLFLSADDYLLPGSLFRLIAEMAAYPEADFVYGRYVFINADSDFQSLVSHPGWENYDHYEFPDEVGRMLSLDLYISMQSTLFKKEVFVRFGRFKDDTPVGDYDYFLGLMSEGARSRFINIPMSAHRVHGNQISISSDFVQSGSQYESQLYLLEKYINEKNLKQLFGYEKGILQVLNSKILSYKSLGGELPKDIRLRINKVKQRVVALTAPKKQNSLPENALVSVIIPTLNRPKTLLKSLESLKAQTYQNWEAIVINDGGTSMAPLIESSDPRVHYIEHRNNMGQSAARNSGLMFAKGDVICFLDDDDTYLNHHLEVIVNGLKNKSFVYTLAEYVVKNTEGELIGSEVLYAETEYSRERLLVENFIPINTFGVRKSILQSAGFFDESMECLEDWELLIRLSKLCDFIHIPEVTVNVNVKQGNTEGVSVSNQHKFYDVYKWVYKKHGDLGAQDLQKNRANKLRLLSGGGASNTNEDAIKTRNDAYREWVDSRVEVMNTDLFTEKLKEDDVSCSTINLLMILLPGEESYLADTIDSLGSQIYTGWKLSVISTVSCPDEIFDSLDSLEWVTISDNDNPFDVIKERITVNACDWVCFVEPGATFEVHCLASVVCYINEHQEWQYIYIDEDALDQKGQRVNPLFKPDFNLDLLRSTPYVGCCCFISTEILDNLGGISMMSGAENYDLAFHVLESSGEQAIGHIAEILAHRPYAPVREFDVEMGLQVLTQHLLRMGVDALAAHSEVKSCYQVNYKADVRSKVSIIIPTNDQLPLLNACVGSILDTTSYLNYEIIIIDNLSVEADTKKYFDEITRSNPGKVRVAEYAKPYNFSAINNFAVEQATGDYVVLLHNDTMVLQAEWLQGMLSQAQRSEVGIVGVKLVFPNKTIQHAGFMLGAGNNGIAEHSHIGTPMGSAGYMNRAMVVQDCSAVTAACLMIEKSLYQQVGGLDEGQFKVLYNDIDLCLKVRELSYKIVWTPYVTLIHHGSSSLKKVKQDKKRIEQSQQEVDSMLEKWLPQLANDPTYNCNLSLRTTNFQPETSINVSWNTDFIGKSRVYAFPMDSFGVGQYRVRAPINALTKANIIVSGLANNSDNLIYPTPVEIERIKPDVLLGQNLFLENILTPWKRYKKFNDVFMVAGLDDLVYTLPAHHPRKEDWVGNIRKNVKEFFQYSDRVVVANNMLAEEFKKLTDNEIIIVPNYLENWRWQSLDLPEKKESKKMRVGWAGGQEHVADLQFILPIVKALHKEVDWIFMGSWLEEFEPYVKEMNGGVEFDYYPQKLADLNLDLAIAPLMHNKFNECKTNLRLLEFGIMSWPVVCSDILPYQNAPVTRVANNTNEWIRVIREKINEPDELLKEGAELKRWVVDNYMLDDHIDEWATALLPN